MNRASAIVTDVGSAAGHMASLSREFDVPTILDAETATSVMQNGQDVTVDAVNCNIYEGRVAELEEFVGKKDESFKETQLFRILQKVLKKASPPQSHRSRQRGLQARVLQDLPRHYALLSEMVVRELFSIVDTSADDVSSVRLVSGMPVEIWLLDLGGGDRGAPKYLNPSTSVDTLHRLPQGSHVHEVARGKGLRRQGVPRRRRPYRHDLWKRSFEDGREELFLHHGYVHELRNPARLPPLDGGVLRGDNINDNYIRFHFKGGGAVVDRRLRR
ncbi:MAG: PEP-utilizing enzyme [Desulfomicrobium escambiense]|nr:PEP-utilizing enzyme [Desulfomicrobium escambiense]